MTDAAVPPVVLASSSFQMLTLAELQKAFDSDTWLTDIRYMLQCMTEHPCFPTFHSAKPLDRYWCEWAPHPTDHLYASSVALLSVVPCPSVNVAQ